MPASLWSQALASYQTFCKRGPDSRGVDHSSGHALASPGVGDGWCREIMGCAATVE